MKYYIIIIFIKVCFNQLIEKDDNEISKSEKNEEKKKLIINYNLIKDIDINLYPGENNSNEKSFILNEQTYIIYPSNNKIIEQYSIILAQNVKNNTSINIGVTPNLAMKMTNKIKNNFIQLILENKNNDNINEIVKININHRKILIKAKEIIGINRGVNILKNLLIRNNLSNKTYNEIHFIPIKIICNDTIKNNNYVYFGLIITFIIIIISFCYIKLNQI